MKAGPMRYRVMLEAPSADPERSTGQGRNRYSAVSEVWADIRSVTGREQLAGQQVQAGVDTRVFLRGPIAGLSPRWRIQVMGDGRTLNIAAVLPSPKGDMIELLCQTQVK